jgi:uncharacterized protein YbjQ (UPF0145 family)
MGDSTPLAPTQFERIQRGGLPDSAVDRLAELRRDGMTSSFFSVPAFAVGATGGVQPIGQVVGACAGHQLVGRATDTRPRGSGSAATSSARWREWDGPVRSWATVRERAIARLIAQAQALGADAVLGVTVRREPQESPSDPNGLVHAGTAARVDPSPATPVAALTSPQEFILLQRAGTDVVGLVGASANVDIWMTGATSRALSRWWRLPSRELDELTTGRYEARRLVMGRLRAAARGLGANGVIGVDLGDMVVERDERPQCCTISIHAWGTAVRKRGAGIAPRSIVGVGG